MTRVEKCIAIVFVIALLMSGFQFLVDFLLHRYYDSGSAFTRVLISIFIIRCVNRSVKQREDLLYPWRRILE